MPLKQETSRHDLIKAEIFSACNDLGFHGFQEYRGKGWRADVYATKDSKKFAFEIQLSPQSLKKTLERQEVYNREGVVGCWLFEKRPSKLTDERPDLPLFYINEHSADSFSVSLSGRKELRLHCFLEQFLSENIKFCNVARANPEQLVKLVFFEMKCWKCNVTNHIYYVDSDFRSACNAQIHPYETLWGSDKNEHRPEILAIVKEFVKTEEGKQIKLGEIKPRFSQTVQSAYMSFGCYSCDSIFGDWYVNDAIMEAIYGYGVVAIIERCINFGRDIFLPISHWCYPGALPFCDVSKSNDTQFSPVE